MDELTIDKIEMILFFVVPGFISLKVWGLLNRSPRFRLSESLLEAIIFSLINALFFLRLFDIMRQVHIVLAYGVVFILFPVIWPCLFWMLSQIPFFRTRLTPTAWNHFFVNSEDCFILLHLKNNQLMGGLYSGKSFASSYPEKADLYIEQLWQLDEKGAFLAPVEKSGGLLVSFEEVAFIEIFKLDFTPLTSFEPDRGAIK
ncbi:hypothetical protein FACS1894137_14470 [Spirochaetia bacterium]|nr:hypothetical protein FACS1894137_14470 [Spirochaetia bacterium]